MRTIIAELLELLIATLTRVRDKLAPSTNTYTPPLPDFDRFQYRTVTPPATARARGWDKLQEAERRLALYRWAEEVERPAPASAENLSR